MIAEAKMVFKMYEADNIYIRHGVWRLKDQLMYEAWSTPWRELSVLVAINHMKITLL